MTAGRELAAGFMAYVGIGISIAVLNGVSGAVFGKSVTTWMTETFGGISLFNSENGA